MIQHFTNSEKPEELLWVEGIVLMICVGSSSNSKFFLPNLLSQAMFIFLTYRRTTKMVV